MKKDKYMKGWKVGQPMTYSEIDRLIEGVRFIMHEGVFVIHNGKFINSE